MNKDYIWTSLSQKVKVSDPNSRELRAMTYLAAFNRTLREDERWLKPRLRESGSKEIWRQFRVAERFLDNTEKFLNLTIPISSRNHIERMNNNYDVILRPGRNATFLDDCQIVPLKVLRMLINCTMENNCAMCIKNTKEVKKCDIRKNLLMITPPRDLDTGYICPFRGVATSCNLGEYI